MPKYCVKCGNTHRNPITGSPCDCVWNADSFFNGVSCVSIPEQYQGLVFNKALVPTDLGDSYTNALQDLYSNIVTMRWQSHNILICSPHQHSKTILAYSCIERLFRASVPVFPVYDVMELRNIISAVDSGREPSYKVDNVENLVEAPYMFVKLPMYPTWECFDTMNTILSRRVRRNNSTIFLYSGTWGQLTYGDKTGMLQQVRGDGSYSTIEVRSFEVKSTEGDL